jgi:hypothetical protein
VSSRILARAVFWVLTLCRLVGLVRFRGLEGTCCLHFQGLSGDAKKWRDWHRVTARKGQSREMRRKVVFPSLTLIKSLLFPESTFKPWKWRRYVSPKRWLSTWVYKTPRPRPQGPKISQEGPWSLVTAYYLCLPKEQVTLPFVSFDADRGSPNTQFSMRPWSC